jgi:GNAT superfamily N-acetyltransferase
MTLVVNPINPGDREWVGESLLAEFGDLRMVTRGRLHHADQLPGLIAVLDEVPAGLLTYATVGGEMEIVTLHAVQPGKGLGSAMLAAALEKAKQTGCRRLWLITTNDNEPAMRFYERRGMRQVAIYKDAIRESRKLKPEIPLTGVDGKPILDEVELEFRLA